MKSFLSALLLLLVLFQSFDGWSKSKYRSYGRRSAEWKGYIGGAIGPAIPLGNFPGNAKTGIDFGTNIGYTFGNNFGLTLNIFDTFQGIKDVSETSTFIKLGCLLGPSYRIKLNDQVNLELKASAGYMASDSLRIVVVGNDPNVTGMGLALDAGASIRYNVIKNIYMVLNIDYLLCKPKYEGIVRDITAINVGFGFGFLIK